MISKNAVIGFLCVSAVVLATILVFQHAPVSPAYGMDSSRAGDFLAATTTIDGSMDVLWLINVRNRLLSVFGVTYNGEINQLAEIDLTMVFQEMAGMYSPLPMQPGQGQMPFGPQTPFQPQTPSQPQEPTQPQTPEQGEMEY